MANFSDGPFSRNTEVPPIELMIAVTMDVVVVAYWDDGPRLVEQLAASPGSCVHITATGIPLGGRIIVYMRA